MSDSQQHHRFLLGAFVAILLSGPATAGGSEEDVFTALRGKVRQSNQKYLGSESRRVITTTEYDQRTGESVNRSEAVVIRKEYFHRKPVNTPVAYQKNGKKLPPSEYKYRSRDPVHLPFDTTYGEQYRYRITARKDVAGRSCHEIELIPVKKTERHLKARLYVDTETLEPVYLEGTIADLPIGVSDIRATMHFKTIDGTSVISRGRYVILVNIPILFPNRRMVSSFVSSDEKLIPR